MRKRMKTNQLRQAEMRAWRRMMDDKNTSITDVVTTLVALAMKGNPLAEEELSRLEKIHVWNPVGNVSVLTISDGGLTWVSKPFGSE